MNKQFIAELKERILKTSSLKPVGETWISFDGVVPFGGVPFQGGLYSKVVFKDLYEYAKLNGRVITESKWQKLKSEQNNNVPFYSDVSNEEFRVPLISGYFKGADAIESAGKYTPEGIPNLTGDFKLGNHQESWGWPVSAGSTNGVFFPTGTPRGCDCHGAGGQQNQLPEIGFDAARCNPVYGQSDHVTPETIQVLVGVYAFSIVQKIGGLNMAEVVNQSKQLIEDAKQIAKVKDQITSIVRAGNRGRLAGYEMSETIKGNAINVNKESPDTLVWEGSGKLSLTFTAAEEQETSIKIAYLHANGTTTLSVAGARWSGGEAPTWGTAGKTLIITCHFVFGEVVLTVSDNNES